MIRRASSVIPLFLFVILAALPMRTLADPVITGVAIEPLDNDGERVKFLTVQPLTPVKAFALNKPERIVIDIPRVPVTGIKLPDTYRGRLIKGIRFGQFDANLSRIVLDLNYPAEVAESTSGQPMMVDIAPVNPLPPAKTGAAMPAKGGNKYVMTAEDKLPLIVIDSGHGGDDPEALGLHKTHEKDITLNYARALRETLLKTGRYKVLLTRDSDKFIVLGDRVKIARHAKADMFISFHADSNPNPDARGLSIYTLSETASDAEAAALAERENKADVLDGIDLNTTDADVASILIDLTQRETMNKSSILADGIVKNMNSKINLLPGTHRFAGFRVLKAPDIPSVLIELGFLSNATDERLLLSPDYRDLVVESVAKGIDRYRSAE